MSQCVYHLPQGLGSGSGVQLGVQTLGGAFMVLGVGIAVASVVAVVELLWRTKKRAGAKHVSRTMWD